MRWLPTANVPQYQMTRETNLEGSAPTAAQARRKLEKANSLKGEMSMGQRFDEWLTRPSASAKGHKAAVWTVPDEISEVGAQVQSDVEVSASDLALQLVMSHRVAAGLAALPHEVTTQLRGMGVAGRTISSIMASKVDPSVMFSMERTFLSSTNISLYIIMIGAGFTAINRMAVESATHYTGYVTIFLGLISAVVHYVVHCRRLVMHAEITPRDTAERDGRETLPPPRHVHASPAPRAYARLTTYG